MTEPRPSFTLDGVEVPFSPGESVVTAARAAGHYIPTLCFHREFAAHGSCKVCTIEVNGRHATGCTTPARAGDVIAARTPTLDEQRRELVQFLFTEGNHFCPSCEQSGDCTLQAVGAELGVTTGHYNPLFPTRPLDASHPDVILERNRCILCELCVRASAQVDGKHVFALSGRGIGKHLIVNAESGRLADTELAATDKAMAVCPVGALLRKRRGFAVPIGQRTFDRQTVAEHAIAAAAPPAAPGEEA